MFDNTIFWILLIILVTYLLSKLFDKIFLRRKTRRTVKRKTRRMPFGRNYLTLKTRRRADRKFNKLKNQFVKQKGRKPNKNETFKIIINASHITIRRRGFIGHWGRQKVRKYLLEKHKIVDKYTMK